MQLAAIPADEFAEARQLELQLPPKSRAPRPSRARRRRKLDKLTAVG